MSCHRVGGVAAVDPHLRCPSDIKLFLALDVLSQRIPNGKQSLNEEVSVKV